MSVLSSADNNVVTFLEDGQKLVELVNGSGKVGVHEHDVSAGGIRDALLERIAFTPVLVVAYYQVPAASVERRLGHGQSVILAAVVHNYHLGTVVFLRDILLDCRKARADSILFVIRRDHERNQRLVCVAVW